MSITISPLRASALAALLTAALAVLAPAAAPAAAPTYPVGSVVTFNITTNAANAKRYGVFLTVAARRRLNRHGGLKRTPIGTFAKMNRKPGGVYKYTTPAYTFDTWFMMVPGVYYWQTSYTDCSVPGCNVYSRVRSFVVQQ